MTRYSSTEIAQALRKFADSIENCPEAEELWGSTGVVIAGMAYPWALSRGADPVDVMRKVRRAIGQKAYKNVLDDTVKWRMDCGGVKVLLSAERETVCTARVVGTETVEVPDPNAPMVTVTRDVIEWDCRPASKIAEAVAS